MRKKILVVEHNVDTLDMIEEILYHHSVDITTAGNVDTAEKLLVKEEFNLVITEALLLKSHGFVLSEFISENYPGIKVIIISEPLQKMDYRREAIEHGACEYIEKPLDAVKFREIVFKHIDLEEKKARYDFMSETTKIHVPPDLFQSGPGKEKETGRDDPGDAGQDKKKDAPTYEIKLE